MDGASMRLVINRRSRTVLMAALLAVPALLSAQGTDAGEGARVAHLLQRTTFGVRPRDVQAVLAMGRTKWLERQLNPSGIDDRAAQQRLSRFATVSRDMTDLLVDYERQRMEQRQRQRQLNMQELSEEQRQAVRDSIRRAEAQKMTPAERRARQLRGPQFILGELVAAKLTRAVYSERQLEEVMTDFWYNHFNVFFAKNLDRYFVADYERTAIRPHVFGKFRDM